MAKILDDAHIHDGHRERMRQKLLKHGQRIFDTYELLEMLLYHVIPYRDTNPISKRLLSAFGGLDGVLSAPKDELMKVDGVGERTADFLKDVDRLASIIGAEILPEEKQDFSTYDAVGSFFVNYFAEHDEKAVIAIFLDSSMRLLSFKKLYELEYSSGGVKPKAFVDEAIRQNATLVISAHNHPYGPFYPTQGDRATNNAVSDALSSAGLIHAEHYIISGNCYAGLGSLNNFKSRLYQMPALDKFLDSRDGVERMQMASPAVSVGVDLSEIVLGNGNYNKFDFDYFGGLLSYCVGKKSGDVAAILLPKHRTIENIFTTSARQLIENVGEKCTLFLKLLAYVTSRRETDKLAFGRKYNQAEIADYLKAVFLGESVENIYLLTYDGLGNFTGCHLVGEGTVSASEIHPRKAVELAISTRAEAVSLAHNHPLGTPQASMEDVNFTRLFESVFASCDIALKGHFIIAGQRCNLLRNDGMIDVGFEG